MKQPQKIKSFRVKLELWNEFEKVCEQNSLNQSLLFQNFVNETIKKYSKNEKGE